MLDNKTILVAGAAGLLGTEITQAVLHNQGRVIACDYNQEHLEGHFAEKGITPDNSKIGFYQLDVTDEKAVQDFITETGLLSGVVNCTYPRNQLYGAHLFDVSMASFNENLSLHLGSSFLLMQQCAKKFSQDKQPLSYVNIASIYGVSAPRFDIYDNTAMTMPVEYAAIKSAIIHLNKYFAAYLNDSRFRINSVSPGGLFDHQPEDFLQAYKKETHGKGMLSAQDITSTVCFLLSDLSKYITGQNIIVDDGFSL